MKFSSTASITREVIVAGLLIFLLLAGCCLLVIGLFHSGWIFAADGCFVEGGYAGAQLLTGRSSHVAWLLTAAKGLIDRRWKKRKETNARRQQACELAAVRDTYLEERVNELIELHVGSRLAELERVEELRSREEWSELRDVWRVLILDSNTPEEIRASCREWLAKYPETLNYLTGALTERGLITEKDLLLDEQWEKREQHKWRVQ